MLEPRYKPGESVIHKARFVTNVGEGDDEVSLWWLDNSLRVYGWDSFGVYIHRDANGARMPYEFSEEMRSKGWASRAGTRINANVPALLAYANMLYGARNA
jgi:hypothetical protein